MTKTETPEPWVYRPLTEYEILAMTHVHRAERERLAAEKAA